MSTIDNTAGAIITFDRLDYLKRCLESLSNAKGSEQIDWYAFIDHPYIPETDRLLCDESIQDDAKNVFEQSDISIEHFCVQPFNKDIVGQKDDAHHLFEHYENMMFFETDFVVGRDYLINLYRAMQQYPDYAVSMYWHRNEGILDELHDFSTARLWGYGMKYGLWKKIRNDWRQYVEWMDETTYRNRVGMPHQDDIAELIGDDVIAHDVVLSELIYNYGSGKLKPGKTRGYYIGKKGHHAYRSGHMWKKREMHQQPDTIEYDDDPVESFRLIL